MTPIEKLMFDALSDEGRVASNPLPPDLLEHYFGADLEAAGFDIRAPHIRIGHWFAFQEHTVGPYRVDFALVNHTGGLVCVECDGHDYHERTKDQAAYDRRRDRYFQSLGWRVMRFTGSEIHRDAAGCVDELRNLLRVIDAEWSRWYSRLLDVREGKPVDV